MARALSPRLSLPPPCAISGPYGQSVVPDAIYTPKHQHISQSIVHSAHAPVSSMPGGVWKTVCHKAAIDEDRAPMIALANG